MNIDEYLKDYSEEEKQVFWDSYHNQHQIYEDFMSQYNLDHECCPECGETLHSETLAAYVFNHDSPELYKDENICVCFECNDKHTTHERVPMKNSTK